MRGLQGRPYVNSRLARGARQITDRPKATGEGLRLANSLLASVVQDIPKSYCRGLQRRQTAFMRGVQGKPTAYWRGEQGRLTSYWRRVQGRPLAYWREVQDVILTARGETQTDLAPYRAARTPITANCHIADEEKKSLDSNLF